MRMTFGSACRNAGLMAVVYFLYVGFQKGHFDVFGWYGVGWSWGDWLVLAVLTGVLGSFCLKNGGGSASVRRRRPASRAKTSNNAAYVSRTQKIPPKGRIFCFRTHQSSGRSAC